MEKEAVNHPDHYGGKDDTYETIKIIEAKDFGFHIGNVFKYISRAGKKTSSLNKSDTENLLEDLKKARWYLDRYIEIMSKTVEK